MARARLCFLGLSAAFLACAAWVFPSQKSEKVSFSREILPILSEKCFTCHGPDPGSRKANLRLDERSSLYGQRGEKWVIVPNDPGKSLLIQRVNDHDSPMPPASSGKTLSDSEKALLIRWVQEGAEYGRLWSFEPLPDSIALPSTGTSWALDDLDRFIYQRLEQEGLEPSRAAPPERWLRRVTLDLTGVPPTEAEIDDFNKNKIFEAVVDRLLASPGFGERMASEWLDAARYSDSYGYQSDLLMPSWPYRDWVVQAFNRNLPYDQFLTEQLAGDLLPNASRDQILATAFNRLHRQSNEGGSIAEEFKTEYAVDRVSTFGTAVLGLTVGCARCHDHKFDPITQKEFYQLYAYFNSIDEYGLLLSTEIVPTPSLLLPNSEQEQRIRNLKSQIQDAKADIQKAEASAVGAFSTKPGLQIDRPSILARFDFETDGDKLPDVDGGPTVAQKLGPLKLVDGRQGKALLFDGDSGLAVRGLPAKERWDPFTWSFWINDPRQSGPVVLLHRTGGTDVGFCGFDLLLQDGRVTARVMRHWPGNALAIKTLEQLPAKTWTHIAWSYDGFGSVTGLRLYLNGKPAKTEVLADSLWKKINAYGDLAPSGGDWCFGQRFREAGFKDGALDDVHFSERALSDSEVLSLFANAPVADAKDYYVNVLDADVRSARDRLRSLQQELTIAEEGIQEVSVMRESTKEVPAYLLARGAYDSPKTEANRVNRGVPTSLPPLHSSEKNDRLALARWATSQDHPLTARVAMNRLWQMVFGTGLVETSENFGTLGSVPTHPELLDFLARRFVKEGWDVKRALKHLVLSATYRQDSVRSNPAAVRKDPQNRFYSRGPSHRLSAEMVRDLVLAASGLLVDKRGGPPVNPYQPAGIWSENNTMSPQFVQSTGEGLYRRSLYTTWKRTTPMPSMLTFDATSREACAMRRPVTATPMQALVLLNDVQFVEAARVLAEKVMTLHQDTVKRVASMYRLLAGRIPNQQELQIVLHCLEEQRQHFGRNKDLAEKLISVGESKADPKHDKTELAAMTVAIQTVLNSDAVIWKR